MYQCVFRYCVRCVRACVACVIDRWVLACRVLGRVCLGAIASAVPASQVVARLCLAVVVPVLLGEAWSRFSSVLAGVCVGVAWCGGVRRLEAFEQRSRAPGWVARGWRPSRPRLLGLLITQSPLATAAAAEAVLDEQKGARMRRVWDGDLGGCFCFAVHPACKRSPAGAGHGSILNN